MAKAKKSEAGSDVAKKPKAVPKKKAAAKSAPAADGAAPLIDTNLAAQAAARMLLARKAGLVSSPAPAPDKDAAKTETSTFKQLKESLSKPHLTGMDSMLDTTAPADMRKSQTPFTQQDQRGHNQTFGADVTRSGVPRRTAG